MPLLPADAIHPTATCKRCHRIVLDVEFVEAAAGRLPAGAEVYAGAGVCESCLFGTGAGA